MGMGTRLAVNNALEFSFLAFAAVFLAVVFMAKLILSVLTRLEKEAQGVD